MFTYIDFLMAAYDLNLNRKFFCNVLFARINFWKRINCAVSSISA